ncbi:MAG: Asp23/Gls24 family envelope stress response protein, partial [Lachnospiraceae bacterium]
GYNVPSTCTKIQDKVKTAIETMTGLEVAEVNIKIVNVLMDNQN